MARNISKTNYKEIVELLNQKNLSYEYSENYTIDLILEWLKVNHDIEIYAFKVIESKFRYSYQIEKNANQQFRRKSVQSDKEFNSFYEAMEGAILYTLKNLI